MIAVVIKSIGAGRKPGDLVDTADWRNADNMIRARQIRPASASEITLYEGGAKSIHKAKKKAP